MLKTIDQKKIPHPTHSKNIPHKKTQRSPNKQQIIARPMGKNRNSHVSRFAFFCINCKPYYNFRIKTTNPMKKILLLTIIASMFFACKKYEDGPTISLRTKEKRLVGKWELTESNIDSITQVAEIVIEFEDDGTASLTPFIKTNSPISIGGNISMNAEWKWTYKKEGIQMSVDTKSITDLLIGFDIPFDIDPSYLQMIQSEYEFEIMRLTNKELWLKYDGDKIWKLEKI